MSLEHFTSSLLTIPDRLTRFKRHFHTSDKQRAERVATYTSNYERQGHQHSTAELLQKASIKHVLVLCEGTFGDQAAVVQHVSELLTDTDISANVDVHFLVTNDLQQLMARLHVEDETHYTGTYMKEQIQKELFLATSTLKLMKLAGKEVRQATGDLLPSLHQMLTQELQGKGSETLVCCNSVALATLGPVLDEYGFTQRTIVDPYMMTSSYISDQRTSFPLPMFSEGDPTQYHREQKIFGEAMDEVVFAGQVMPQVAQALGIPLQSKRYKDFVRNFPTLMEYSDRAIHPRAILLDPVIRGGEVSERDFPYATLTGFSDGGQQEQSASLPEEVQTFLRSEGLVVVTTSSAITPDGKDNMQVVINAFRASQEHGAKKLLVIGAWGGLQNEGERVNNDILVYDKYLKHADALQSAEVFASTTGAGTIATGLAALRRKVKEGLQPLVLLPIPSLSDQIVYAQRLLELDLCPGYVTLKELSKSEAELTQLFVTAFHPSPEQTQHRVEIAHQVLSPEDIHTRTIDTFRRKLWNLIEEKNHSSN